MPLWDTIDFAAYIVEIILAATFAGLCLRRATLKDPDSDKSLRFFLLSGVFACVCLADLFYVLTWAIAEYPDPFSVADLSWIGGYVFLIAADMHLVHGFTATERRAAGAYRLPALIAPLIVCGFTAVYILSNPGTTFNYVFTAIPLAICAYYTLWLLLAQRKGVGGQGSHFHMAVLLFIAADLLYVLFNALGWDSFAVPATLSGELYVAALIWMFLSIRKEAAL